MLSAELVSSLSALRLDSSEDELLDEAKAVAIKLSHTCTDAQALTSQMRLLHALSLESPLLAAQTSVLYRSLRHLQVGEVSCRRLILTNVQQSFVDRHELRREQPGHYLNLVHLIANMCLWFRLADEQPVKPLANAAVALLAELVDSFGANLDCKLDTTAEEKSTMSEEKSTKSEEKSTKSEEKSTKSEEKSMVSEEVNEDSKEIELDSKEVDVDLLPASNTSSLNPESECASSKEFAGSTDNCLSLRRVPEQNVWSDKNFFEEMALKVCVLHTALLGPDLRADMIEDLSNRVRNCILRRPSKHMLLVLELMGNEWQVSSGMRNFYPEQLLALVETPLKVIVNFEDEFPGLISSKVERSEKNSIMTPASSSEAEPRQHQQHRSTQSNVVGDCPKIGFTSLSKDARMPAPGQALSSFDITSSVEDIIHPGQSAVIETGLQVQAPSGFRLRVQGNKSLIVDHLATVFEYEIDSCSVEEIKLVIFNSASQSLQIRNGMSLAKLQCMPFLQSMAEPFPDLI